MKKMPKLFRKKYTKSKLDKKIFKKIYIPDDKKFVESFLEQTTVKNKEIYTFVPKKGLDKKQYKRLKTIAKQIKKNKKGFKPAPLIAVAASIVVIAVGFTTFKNVILKKAIVKTCESIFDAKCDIKSVNLKFFDSSLKIKEFEQADKNNYMKNIVSIDSIVFDFDLTQLLKGRFVADELSIEGVDTNTDRKTSGELPKKEKADKKKDKKKAEENGEKSPFMETLNKKNQEAQNKLQTSFMEMFGDLDPQTILNKCLSMLQTPAVAEDVKNTTEELIKKYSNKPAEIEAKVNEVTKAVEEVQKIDISSMASNPEKIKETIQIIQSTCETAKKLQAETTEEINSIKKDAETVQNLTTSIKKAFDKDTKFVNDEINKIKGFSASDALNDAFNTLVYTYLGKYYPYYQKGVEYLKQAKESNSNKAPKEKKEKKVKEKKKNVLSRAKGRTVLFNKEQPKLWIKKAAGSGPNFSFTAKNITNNMNIINAPADLDVDILLAGVEHKAFVVVDTRDETSNPIFEAKYNCSEFPISVVPDLPDGINGVPSIKSDLDVHADFKIIEDSGFDLSCGANFSKLEMSVEEFSPDYAYTLYSDVLKRFTTMKADLEVSYLDEHLGVLLNSDIGEQFMKAIAAEMDKRFTAIKKELKNQLDERIKGIANEANLNIDDFNSIYSKIKEYAADSDKLTNEVNNKLNEAQKALEKQLKAAANDALEKAKDEAEKKTKEALKGLLGF